MSALTTVEQVQEAVRTFAKANPGAAWVVGRGWTYTVFPGGLPTRQQLDAAVPDRPALMTAYDGHTSWANSRALELGANFIITHEPTFYNHEDHTGWLEDDPVYRAKRRLLDESGLAVWRFHDQWHMYPGDGIISAVATSLGWQDSAGIKWAGGFLDNYKIGLPYISSLIMLIDPQNGRFRAVVDGALITNLRTGAQSAVALKYLHPEKRLRLGLFGAGAQGRTQTRAAAELFELRQLALQLRVAHRLEKETNQPHNRPQAIQECQTGRLRARLERQQRRLMQLNLILGVLVLGLTAIARAASDARIAPILSA